MKKGVGGAVGGTREWAGPFGSNGQIVSSLDGVTFSEGELLLQALNGFVLVITAEGYVFYSSPTIQDYLGFHQSDVVHQSVFELIHTDDRAMFRRQLHFALNPTQGDDAEALQKSSDITSNMVNYNPQQLPPENSSFLERSFCCRFRCLLDNSSGFLALNFHGRLKYLHGQNAMAEDGTVAHPQLALFAIATPLQPPSILEIRNKTLIFQTKHKLDFTPMGVDTRGKVVLGYTEIELCMRGSGYQFIHAADMMYCADNHVRMIKTGESGFTVFRLLSKSGTWIWVQANARLVYKAGRPDFIVARQRALTNEEGEEHLRQRKLQLPFSLATGEAVLYETGPSLDMGEPPGQGRGGKLRKAPALAPSSLLSAMLKQDQSIYQPNEDPSNQFMDRAFRDSHALFNVPGNTWQELGGSGDAADIKEESTVREMKDSLQQIIGDSTLCGNLDELDVGQDELKEWENTLLRMNNINSEMPVEISDINEIFTYVEDMLFKEVSGGLPEQLPKCLSELQLQGAINDLEAPGVDFLAIQEDMETSDQGRGTVKLSHMRPDIMAIPQTCLAPQNQNQSGLIPSHPGNMVRQLSNQPTTPMAFHGQGSLPHNPSAVRQWVGEPCTRNVPLPQKVPLNQTAGSCLQGQFSFNAQAVANQRLPVWQSAQHPVSDVPSAPNMQNASSLPSGHNHVLYGQTKDVQQQYALNPLMLPSNFNSCSRVQPSANSLYAQQSEFVPSTAAANPVCVQQGEFLQQNVAMFGQQGEPMPAVIAAPPTPNNSCMFERAPQAPVNGEHYGPVGHEAVLPPRQKTKGFLNPSLAQGFFPGGMGIDGLVNSMTLPPEGPTINAIVCQLPLGAPDGVYPQQPFLNCNGQTQTPMEENGMFQYPPITGGNPCFTSTNQNNNF